MSDHFELLVGSTQGEGPSPEFVADLRAQIVAETMPTEERTDDPTVIDLEPRPQRETTMIKTKTGWLIGAVAAAIVLIVGFAIVNDDDEGGLAVTNDVSTTTTTTAPTTTAPTTTAPTTSAPDPEPTAEALEAIDQLLAARDYETLASVMTEAGLASLRGQSGFLIETEEEANAEFMAFEIIGLARTADSCVTAGATVVRCQVTQTSIISEAMGDETTVRDATFNFEGELISVFPGLPGGGVDMGAYARGVGIEEELDAVCPRTGSFPPECAQFAIDQLDDWVRWEQANS